MLQPILGITKEFVSAQVAVQSFIYECMRIISHINTEILVNGCKTWLKKCWFFSALKCCEIGIVKPRQSNCCF